MKPLVVSTTLLYISQGFLYENFWPASSSDLETILYKYLSSNIYPLGLASLRLFNKYDGHVWINKILIFIWALYWMPCPINVTHYILACTAFSLSAEYWLCFNAVYILLTNFINFKRGLKIEQMWLWGLATGLINLVVNLPYKCIATYLCQLVPLHEQVQL